MKFKTQPYKFQREVFERQKDAESFALFLEMGLGKSKIALDTAAHLFLAGKIDRLIVIAPNGVHAMWAGQVDSHLADEVPRHVFVWRGFLTEKDRSRLKRSLTDGKELTVILVNVESLSTSQNAKDLVRGVASSRSMMAVDESTRIKNPSAKRSKFVIAAGQRCGYRRILTGTPVTQSPFDLYSQFRFLDPGILGFSSYFYFQKRYGEFVTEVARRGEKSWSYEKLIAYCRMEELQSLIAPKSARLRKEDCLDLPKKIYQKIPVPLTSEQRKIYKTMDRDGVADFDSFEVLSPLRITRLLKMAQICSGFILDESGEAVMIGGRNPKLEVLLDLMSDFSGKAVVSCRFRHEIKLVVEALGRIGGVVEYHGGTPQKDRTENVRLFQEDPEVRFLVGQERALIGVTLTAAEMMVFWSNEFSYEARYQCEDRCHRIGQKKSVVYVDLVGEKTVEERVVEVLDRCREVADGLIDGKGLQDRMAVDRRGRQKESPGPIQDLVQMAVDDAAAMFEASLE